MSYREIAFYNQCNNGDIHVSRELVKYTVKLARAQHPDAKITYYHRNSPRLTVDMPEVEHRPLTDMLKEAPPGVSSFQHLDGVYLNTWYAASPVFGSMFCTLNTLHELFKAHLRAWFGHDIDPDLSKFLPTYDWRLVVGADTVDRWYLEQRQHEGHRRWVLLCNGQPMSGQTNMPPGAFEAAMQPIIDAHPETLFLVTNEETHRFSGANVIGTRTIICRTDCDLPEVAYLSGFCDVIIGRGSGPYSFSLLSENLLSPDKTFVCFTDDRRVADWVYMSDAVKAKILWSNHYQVESMRALVEGVLK
jgi:hypothetical protein